MSEINREPKEVEEQLVVVLTNKNMVSAEELVNRISETKQKYQHLVYDNFKVGLVKNGTDFQLAFYGVRKENAEELKARVDKEELVKKNVDEAELKEFLRLRKKFDKAKE